MDFVLFDCKDDSSSKDALSKLSELEELIVSAFTKLKTLKMLKPREKINMMVIKFVNIFLSKLVTNFNINNNLTLRLIVTLQLANIS